MRIILYLVDIAVKYFAHILQFPDQKVLESIGNELASSDYRRKKVYFDGEGENEVDLKSKFEQVRVENALLQGSVRFETVEEGTDLDGNFNILKKSNELDFFIGLKPRNHLVIRGTASLARILTKIVSGIIYSEQYGHIIRLKLTNGQIYKFLDSNEYTLKSQIKDARLDGISTVAYHGSDVEKPIEVNLISKYLTEYQAIRIHLHKEEWIIWISKKTGALSCMSAHDPSQFVKFIQQKILTLAV